MLDFFDEKFFSFFFEKKFLPCKPLSALHSLFSSPLKPKESWPGVRKQILSIGANSWPECNLRSWPRSTQSLCLTESASWKSEKAPGTESRALSPWTMEDLLRYLQILCRNLSMHLCVARRWLLQSWWQSHCIWMSLQILEKNWQNTEIPASQQR